MVPSPSGLEHLSREAHQALSRTLDFSPDQWAGSKQTSEEEWRCLGSVYQSAVVLYCIHSLQSLSVLHFTHSLREYCTKHSQLLQGRLGQALTSPRLKRFVLWPLVLLGMEAVNGSRATRTFVMEQLQEMSRHVGTYVPLTAKAVLERFWASGETSWDSCFDRPYAFATQIAVDISQILPAH